MIEIKDYSFEFEEDVLDIIEKSHYHYKLSKSKPFKREVQRQRLRHLAEQMLTDTAFVRVAIVDCEVAGILILSKFTHIFDESDGVWMEHIWYPSVNFSSMTRSKVMLSLLDDFLSSVSGTIVFTLPYDAETLIKALNSRGFEKTETHLMRIS